MVSYLIVQAVDLPDALYPVKAKTDHASIIDLNIKVVEGKALIGGPPMPRCSPRTGADDDLSGGDGTPNRAGMTLMNANLGPYGWTDHSQGRR